MAVANCPERTNWYQCIRLLMEGGRTVLKEFIKKSYIRTPGSLDLFLNQHKDTLSSLRRDKVLKNKQWDKLFPSADLENMDITLLSCIICNCITQPRSVERRAVNDLRELRNSLHGHASTESMNKDEFERNWREITTVLSNTQTALGVSISLNESITKIENEKVVNYDLVWDELEAWEHVDALMRDMKEQRKEISDVKDELLYVKDRVSNIEKKFEDEKKLTIDEKDQTYKKALAKAWGRLVEEMDSGELLDKSLEKELLRPIAIRDLRDKKITSQRNRAVLEKVKTLGPEKYEVFKECLTMIKQEHLAKLLHDYEREIEAQDEADAIVTPDMDQTYKKALDKAWARLVEEMDSGELLDKFMEKELLSPVAIRDLREEKITSQRNRTVLEKVRTLGPEKYEVYKECLTMIKQEHLAKLLHDYEREITAQD